MYKVVTIFLIFFLFFSCREKEVETVSKNNSIPALTNIRKAKPIPPGKAVQALWLVDPAISNNGKHIAFSYKGNIYISDVTGGAARPLTLDRWYNANPIWSPDDKQIAFTSARDGNYNIYIISVSGGTSKQLTFASSSDYPSAFSPDGKEILFSSTRQDSKDSALFPSGALPELYTVSINTAITRQVLTIPAIGASFDKKHENLIYYDKKGYENNRRKHHKSSITRDIWLHNIKTKSFNKLTSFNGEDREPVWSSDYRSIFYLSEENGSFNIHKLAVANPEKNKQITEHTTHPVRSLSISNNNKLCYSYDGNIYTVTETSNPQKLEIYIPAENNTRNKHIRAYSSGAREAVLSPNNKEVALVVHGEIYVTSIETGLTKRITRTAQEERWVSFNKDGTKILYASEREGSWNIYETTIKNKEEKYFILSTVLEEKPLVKDETNTFQPKYAPDGKKIAFIRERTILVVKNLKTNKEITVVPEGKTISYVDGDQQFSWSPDSKFLAIRFNDRDRWSGEVGIVPANGSTEIFNITNNGYEDLRPLFKNDGSAVAWMSNRKGDVNIYALFTDQKALDLFHLTNEEYQLQIADKKKNNKSKHKKSKKSAKKVTFKLDKKNILERTVRLTKSSSNILRAVFSPDGEKLYTLVNKPDKYLIRELNLREKKEKTLTSIPHPPQNWWRTPPFVLQISSDGKRIITLIDGTISRINTIKKKIKPVPFKAEFSVDKYTERKYMFDHVWQTINKKFYEKSLHKIDWPAVKEAYEKFLPHINNNFDFANLLSEMLGELNVSHTGSGYRYRKPYADRTASLGFFPDPSYKEKGVKIAEIIKGSPLIFADSNIKAGDIIKKIDNIEIDSLDALHIALNRKAGKYTLVELQNPRTRKQWHEKIKPISRGHEHNLLYKRWVNQRKEIVDKRSDSRLGYVHIRGMNKQSFRKIYGDIMGKYADREGIVVDTRFNGGGWLHNDLAILFSGKEYTRFAHRGTKNFGGDPENQWTKKTILLVGESNYSDAHLFPYAYKTLKLGKIVGMPVPGTATAVWWPYLIDRSLYFGVPQIGIIDVEGDYLENKQLIPDVIIANEPGVVSKGKDQQLEKAIELILEDINKDKKATEDTDKE